MTTLLTRLARVLRRTAGIRPVPMARRTAPAARQRFLLVAYFDPAGYRTLSEFLDAIGGASRYRFDLLNLWGFAYPGGLELPAGLNLGAYDGLFISSAVSYNVDNLITLDRTLRRTIADYDGLKIMMKQDENFRTNRVVEYLASRRFDILLTCVPQESSRTVYPLAALPGLHLVHGLTGYVSDDLRRTGAAHAQEHRPIDVGYRGSIQPAYFGRLSYEKRQIGEIFERVGRERGLTCDISSRWEDRFGGDEWLRFLGRLKGVLGVESGASIFDFDGEIERACERYQHEHPRAGFEEIHAAILAEHEGNVYYNQISPRHFEAAACRTVQIMYEGRYSGIFQAGRHYLPLRRDLGNLDEVLDRLLDPAERRRLTDAAYEEIIENEQYGYDSLVERLDEAIESGLNR